MKEFRLSVYTDPYPEDQREIVSPAPVSRIDRLAGQAASDTYKWYGRLGGFDANNHVPPMPLTDWFKRHWELHPRSSPDGGATIEHEPPPNTPISLAERSRKLLGATVKVAKALDRVDGFTGDICQDCGGVRMVRTGTCVTCQDCGSASGGCS